MRKTKKFFVTALACTMIAATSVPAFASETEISTTFGQTEILESAEDVTEVSEESAEEIIEEITEENLLASGTEIKTGWQKTDNNWYYFNEDGNMTIGWQKINGVWYYFDSTGVMQTGWVKDNGIWYYMNSSGAMVTGWQKVNDTWYYMNSSGAMQTGWVKVNGLWYYMNSSGAMTTGWQKINGKWYYMADSGKMLTGWQKVNGSWYYMDASGVMQTGWLILGEKKYYLDDSGKMMTGWINVTDTLGHSKWYFCNESGEIATGWLYRGLDSKGEEIWYLLQPQSGISSDSYGAMLGPIFQEQGGIKYIFDDSGKLMYYHKSADTRWFYDDTKNVTTYSPSGKIIRTMKDGIVYDTDGNQIGTTSDTEYLDYQR